MRNTKCINVSWFHQKRVFIGMTVAAVLTGCGATQSPDLEEQTESFSEAASSFSPATRTMSISSSQNGKMKLRTEECSYWGVTITEDGDGADFEYNFSASAVVDSNGKVTSTSTKYTFLSAEDWIADDISSIEIVQTAGKDGFLNPISGQMNFGSTTKVTVNVDSTIGKYTCYMDNVAFNFTTADSGSGGAVGTAFPSGIKSGSGKLIDYAYYLPQVTACYDEDGDKIDDDSSKIDLVNCIFGTDKDNELQWFANLTVSALSGTTVSESESNNSRSSADNMSSAVNIAGSLSSSSDVDYYYIDVSAGQTITARADITQATDQNGKVSNLSPSLALTFEDSNGAKLGTNSSSSSSYSSPHYTVNGTSEWYTATTTIPNVSYTNSGSSTVRVYLKSVYSGTSGTTYSGTYNIIVSKSTTTSMSESESNNTIDTADPVASYVKTIKASISSSDKDYFKYELAAGKTLTITTTGDSSTECESGVFPPVAQLDILNSSGAVLAAGKVTSGARQCGTEQENLCDEDIYVKPCVVTVELYSDTVTFTASYTAPSDKAVTVYPRALLSAESLSTSGSYTITIK